MANDLTRNTSLIYDDVRMCKSKKKEDALLASNQVWQKGVRIYVRYGNVGYNKLTDGVSTFSELPEIGGGSPGGDDASTLEGQPGSYYLNRANHTGTQAISTISGLQGQLNNKANTDDLGTAAAADVGDFATSAQGSLAESAVQPDDLPDFGTAAEADVSDFATAAQGSLANSALQNIIGLIVDGTNVTITGSGTSADPYVISASGGGGGGGQVDSVSAGTGISVDSSNPESPEVSLSAGAQASLGLADSAVQPAALSSGLAEKLDVGTGTQDATTYRRGDGTWATPTNTTYSAITQANAQNPASTTVGLVTGQRLAEAFEGRIVAVSSSKSLALTDRLTYQNVTAASTLTVPANADVAFSVGTVIQGFGQTVSVTFAAAAGVTIYSDDDLLSTKPNTAWSLKKVATDSWHLIGSLQ